MPRALTTEEWIQRSIGVHGTRYDYSKVNYQGSREKVTIICSIHGKFRQAPFSHLKGINCTKCGRKKASDSRRNDKEAFLRKAVEKHGGKYNYSKVVYVTSQDKVLIICPLHGEFSQTPSNHYKFGCLKCGNESTASKRRKRLEEFITQAEVVHGNKYDYSNVDYVNNRTKVNIICSKHGPFSQTPGAHLRGQGCVKCSFNPPLSKEEAIEKARLVHGDKYDYSKFVYTTAEAKSIIICPIHGEFKQSLSVQYKQGQGCPKCGLIKLAESMSSNTSEFIKKATSVHGDDYDYSKVNYRRSNELVTIVCSKHGDFLQTANRHLSGAGCQKCKGGIRYTKEFFIEMSNEVHSGKYDYSKVDYDNSKKEVTVVCPIHGEFEQLPVSHMGGTECKECGRKKASDSRKMTTEDFIQRAIEVHGDMYDYSITEYVGIDDYVRIICPEHGEFLQTANRHINAMAKCRKCYPGGFREELGGYYYVHEYLNEDGDRLFFKGGISHNWESRLKSLRRAKPENMILRHVGSIWNDDGNWVRNLETRLLREEEIRAPKRDFDGGSELFFCNPLEYAYDNNLITPSWI